MTALQGWIVIGLLVLIMLGIVGIGVELKKRAAVPMAYRRAERRLGEMMAEQPKALAGRPIETGEYSTKEIGVV